MNKKIASLGLLICFCLSGFTSFSQHKYWVQLADKNGTPYSISNPSQFLTQKSIQRRTTYNIPVTESDLPVNPSYVSQIENVQDVTVLYVSKWLNGVVVTVPNRTLAVTALSTISSFSFVEDTGRVKRYSLNTLEPVKIETANEASYMRSSSASKESAYNYGGSYWQNKQLNVICLHEQGFRGQGMTIGVMDAGFSEVDTAPVFDSIRGRGGIKGTRNFADGGTNVYMGSAHGSGVLSCIAGNKPGRILGSAPLADFWLFRTEEGGETISEEYNWIRAAEFADSVGVDILTTSLGYTDFDDPMWNHTYATLTGRKAPMSIAANMAARKGMFVLNAAGNEGASSFHYISVPGDADSICTVGAIDSLENVAGFSSVGPTYDKRIKPELVARGANAWIGISDGYPANGTSFATPILAGAVACFWQAHRQYNAMKILDTLKKGANNRCAPNNSRGWGVPKMCPEPILVRSTALLGGKNNHEGIQVNFIASSSTARTNSTLTKADGSYSLHLMEGTYKIAYSKPYFNSTSYKDSSLVKIDFCSNNTLDGVTLSAQQGLPEIQFDFNAYADAEKQLMTVFLTDAGYEYVEIQVYDLAGKTLLSAKPDAKATNIPIDISNLSDGVYLVKVKTSKGTNVKKVLKRK